MLRCLVNSLLFGLATLLLLALLPLLPNQSYRQALTRVLQQETGQPVEIGRLQYGLVPQPWLRLRELRIGDTVSAQQLEFQLPLLPLLQGRIEPRNTTASDVAVDGPRGLALLRRLGSGTKPDKTAGQDEEWFLQPPDTLQIKSLRFRHLPWLGSLDGTLGLAADWQLRQLQLTARQVPARLYGGRGEQGLRLALEATYWSPPVSGASTLSRLKARALLRDEDLRITRLSASYAGGQLEASGVLSWDGPWRLQLELQGAKMQLAGILKPMGLASNQGVVEGRCRFDSSSQQFGKLWSSHRNACSFTARNGVIGRVDLAAAARSAGAGSREGTPFKSLKGRLVEQGGRYRFSQIEMRSQNLEASGETTIQADGELAGSLLVGLRGSGGFFDVPLTLSGNLSSPNLRPSNAALAGAAAGTALLGPGLGTAVGFRAGSLLQRIRQWSDEAD